MLKSAHELDDELVQYIMSNQLDQIIQLLGAIAEKLGVEFEDAI